MDHQRETLLSPLGCSPPSRSLHKWSIRVGVDLELTASTHFQQDLALLQLPTIFMEAPTRTIVLTEHHAQCKRQTGSDATSAVPSHGLCPLTLQTTYGRSHWACKVIPKCRSRHSSRTQYQPMNIAAVNVAFLVEGSVSSAEEGNCLEERWAPSTTARQEATPESETARDTGLICGDCSFRVLREDSFGRGWSLGRLHKLQIHAAASAGRGTLTDKIRSARHIHRCGRRQSSWQLGEAGCSGTEVVWHVHTCVQWVVKQGLTKDHVAHMRRFVPR